jgi:transaldolase/glucose-6-phosphate isomerase
MNAQLEQLAAAGQSVWLDNLRRSMLSSGELRRLIDAGLRGLTSNPTIFEKAIGSGNDYDAQLRDLLERERDPARLFEALAIEDIRRACDEFRPLYDASTAGDGFVSLEVSPLLARDTQGTIEAARRLWAAVERPNVMIKIPATPECIPAIAATIAEGINVNVTLIFSAESYEAAAIAYLEGLETRCAAGLPIDRIGSVASVFVSRIDSAVDMLLKERIEAGQTQLASLLGKTGVANLKLIYQRFRTLFEGERFEALRARGALLQRPLWASTGTKNPAYSPLLYVEELVGEHTVNTVPPATLDALMARGVVRPGSIESGLPAARATLAQLAAAHISLFDVTERLRAEGVASFAASYSALLTALEAKRELLGGSERRETLALAGDGIELDATLQRLADERFLAKLWSEDPAHALGWLDFPERVQERLGELSGFAADCAKLFEHVVVLGVGGNALAPDVLRATFGTVAGYPHLHVLDSTDPAEIATLEAALDLETTLFVVSSKSGTTTEPEVFFRYFFDRLQKLVGADAAGKQFVAITDPGTPLAGDATPFGFRRVFENDPDLAGRCSALSYFGIVPAALAGYDVATLLDRGLNELMANSRTTPEAEAPAVRFGAALGLFAARGRDKLTIVTHPQIAAFGAWAEHLIAESTGKNGTGIVPVAGETLGLPSEYGDDRVFAYVGQGLSAVAASSGIESSDVAEIESRLQQLERAGHPVIRLRMKDRFDLGRQFALWEIATATAGRVLGIDAFARPDVAASNDNAERALAAFRISGKFVEPAPACDGEWARVFPLAGSRGLAFGAGDDPARALAAILAQVRPGDYVAITAFIERNDAHARALDEIRRSLRGALKVATTAGFGPRFLHSTGQLHKGGPPSAVVLEVTADPAFDLEIPGRVSFATLSRAQALGDFEALDARGRRGARIHLTVPVERGLAALADAVQDAVMAKA